MVIHNLPMDFIKIGKNKKDNWKLVQEADPDDLWFHVEGYPSTHILLDYNAPKNLIKICAQTCKQRSKAKKEKNVSVVYTKVSNITLGRHEGEVIIQDPTLCKYIILRN